MWPAKGSTSQGSVASFTDNKHQGLAQGPVSLGVATLFHGQHKSVACPRPRIHLQVTAALT